MPRGLWNRLTTVPPMNSEEIETVFCEGGEDTVALRQVRTSRREIEAIFDSANWFPDTFRASQASAQERD